MSYVYPNDEPSKKITIASASDGIVPRLALGRERSTSKDGFSPTNTVPVFDLHSPSSPNSNNGDCKEESPSGSSSPQSAAPKDEEPRSFVRHASLCWNISFAAAPETKDGLVRRVRSTGDLDTLKRGPRICGVCAPRNVPCPHVPSAPKSIKSVSSAPSMGAGVLSFDRNLHANRPASKQTKLYYKRQNALIDAYQTDIDALELFRKYDTAQRRSSGAAGNDGGIAIENAAGLADVVVVVDGAQTTSNAVTPPPDLARRTSVNPALDQQRKSLRRAALLAKLTLLVNIVLMLLKALAVGLSGSLSIVSSLVDSVVDITSGLAIWLTTRAIKHRDPYLYPRGRTRLEPLALVIVSVIMAVASIQMVIQATQAIVSGAISPVVEWPTLTIMCLTIAVKFALWLVCRHYGDNPNTRLLGQDHRNDCVSNSVALLCAFLAQHFWLYLDPIGAILVSVYIAGTWFATGYDQIVVLSGRTADPSFINRILKVCIEHDARIRQIDTVYVYHYGTDFLIELHVVVDGEMRLREAHDVSEPLQRKLEHLPYVERAFVHVDYETAHRPEDEHKIV